MPRDAPDPADELDRRLAAEAARRESVARREADAARGESAARRDPETARRESAARRDPETARRETAARRDPETARRETAARRDPETARRETAARRDPETARRETAARRDVAAGGHDAARRDVAAGRDGAASGADDAHVRRDGTAEDLARRGAAARREAAARRDAAARRVATEVEDAQARRAAAPPADRDRQEPLSHHDLRDEAPPHGALVVAPVDHHDPAAAHRDAVACADAARRHHVRSGRSHRSAAAARAGLAHLSVVAPAAAAVAPVLRVVDVAPRDAGAPVLAYLEAKARFAEDTGAFEHHVVAPGRRALRRALGDLEPDVVFLHDPSWWPRHAVAAARAAGARVVTVHHRPAALAAAALPGPDVVLRPAVDAWRRHAATPADAAVVVGDPGTDAIATRPGLEPGLGEHPGTPRGDAVLYAGPFAPGRGVELLLDAAARSREQWPLHLAGAGAHGDALFTRAVRLGLGQRVAFRPLPATHAPAHRAALFAGAACVVLPAPDEPAAPVALEAAAAGARVVACAGSPAADALGPLAHRFAPRDPAGLRRAIAQARTAPRDPAGAAALRERHAWPTVFADELAALRELIA